MSKSRGFLSILVPSATVFFSSACIMIIELVAGRLIARHLGSSLYTWTSVIGVVLAGITIGNYLGGRIADRFPARKALAVLFGTCSVACVIIVVLNNFVGDWIWLWKLSWPMRVFSHVTLVFLLPSTLLGMISPVVAKMALDRGLPTGRTVGDIYAWGAAGSIAGTFLAGFYLIAVMGTIAIIWTVGAALLLIGILYWARLWVLYIWAIIFIALMTMGMMPADWAEDTGSSMGLRKDRDPNVLYEDESQYCYIVVEQLSQNPDKRAFVQDRLIHSEIEMDNILDLKYSYEQIHAAVTHILSHNKDKLSFLVIGGGGYVFPRYLEKVWPGSRVDVVEIDPGVTEAAMQAFGLQRNTAINIFTMDARNYVGQLLEQHQTEEEEIRYDFIYEDALNDYSVPYQLTTKEFNDQIARILTDDGVYMIEMIDIYDSGLFVGSFINTLEQTFEYVYVITEQYPPSTRNTFVILAANREINLQGLREHNQVKDLELWILDDSEIGMLKAKASGITLMDDYAPVENLLAPVVRKSTVRLLAEKYREQAQTLVKKGKWEKGISKYKDAIRADPTVSISAYGDIGVLLAKHSKFEEAIDAFKSALEYNEKAKFKQSMSVIYYYIGASLKRLGRRYEAVDYLQKAIGGYKQDLAKDPDSIKIVIGLGKALTENGNFTEAAEYFRRTVNMDPYDVQNYITLADVCIVQGRYDEAIKDLKNAVHFFMSSANDEQAVRKLTTHIELVKFQKAKQNK